MEQDHQRIPLDGLGAGAFFGEIGLIEQIPRTATVTALTPTHLLRIEGDDFLQALTQSTPSPALLDRASLRLRRTHPSRASTHSGIQAPTKTPEVTDRASGQQRVTGCVGAQTVKTAETRQS